MKWLCPMVFLLVLFGGVAFLLCRAQIAEGNAEKSMANGSAVEETGIVTEKLPDLYLPPIFKGKKYFDGGWEVAGVSDANFVSTRAQLNAWLQNQAWQATEIIQLESGTFPKMLLAFEKDGYEIIFQLKRLSENETYFAYRREKKQPSRKGFQK